ncbi:hypothetical protein LX32DRAFT_280796 [Colletotrichum zoysiae]|uniref:Uncharacterized protein n=1 Tax=Colletotrichum zoysiae TaxID=1216348 RepID=A0AAD9M732_9PEZI|nr:hypothetical protein LX32DRAFT_280796 [Colletotrichum zoysiae]
MLNDPPSSQNQLYDSKPPPPHQCDSGGSIEATRRYAMHVVFPDIIGQFSSNPLFFCFCFSFVFRRMETKPPPLPISSNAFGP